MTHEILTLLETAQRWHAQGKRLVLTTVVSLEGSSYRRPGVRMLIADSNEMCGAVSGGCVEKEVLYKAQSVFSKGIPKIMSYDGRYRLGCEGILYLLIEPLHVSESLAILLESINSRISFNCVSIYSLSEGEDTSLGSQFIIDSVMIPVQKNYQPSEEIQLCFEQEFPPLFQLYIFGSEHDAVALCRMASEMGWRVTIIAAPDEAKTIDFFPDAYELLTLTFAEIESYSFDSDTAIVLMSHSFNKDVQYLIALAEVKPIYFGLLGPSKRREQLIHEFLNHKPETTTDFLDQLYGPAGINLGAENAHEISISIIAEILSVTRNQKPSPLREKKGRIHE